MTFETIETPIAKTIEDVLHKDLTVCSTEPGEIIFTRKYMAQFMAEEVTEFLELAKSPCSFVSRGIQSDIIVTDISAAAELAMDISGWDIIDFGLPVFPVGIAFQVLSEYRIKFCQISQKIDEAGLAKTWYHGYKWSSDRFEQDFESLEIDNRVLIYKIGFMVGLGISLEFVTFVVEILLDKIWARRFLKEWV